MSVAVSSVSNVRLQVENWLSLYSKLGDGSQLFCCSVCRGYWLGLSCKWNHRLKDQTGLTATYPSPTENTLPTFTYSGKLHKCVENQKVCGMVYHVRLPVRAPGR